MKKNNIICIVMATILEAKPFVTGLRLSKCETKPFLMFQGDTIFLTISGIGKVNAALATAYCCQKYHPASVLNLGAAGATTNMYRHGDVLHIHKIIEFDRPDFKTGAPCQYEPDIMKEFSTAVLATSDKVIMDLDERRHVSTYADLVDMEGASIVRGCKKFGIPSYLYKFVSDTPNDTDESSIIQQIRKNRSIFYDFISSSVIQKLVK